MSKEKTCTKCGKNFSYNPYFLNGTVVCGDCARKANIEWLEKTYPTPEKKLLGIIEHLDKLNTNLQNQGQQIEVINNNVGCIKTFLIITFILGVIAGIIISISNSLY